MKKSQKTSDRPLRLRSEDLASVRGGGISGGGAPLAIVGGGRAPRSAPEAQ